MRAPLAVLACAALVGASSFDERDTWDAMDDAEYSAMWAQKMKETGADKAVADADTHMEDMMKSRMARPLTERDRRRQERAEQQGKQDKAYAKEKFTQSAVEAREAYKLAGCVASLNRTRTHTVHNNIKCYDRAIHEFPLNATWYKRRGAHHHLADAPSKAVADYNESVSLFFAMARYGTKAPEEMLEAGKVKLLTLFEKRDVGTAIEIAKLLSANATFFHKSRDALSLYEWLIDGKRADDEITLIWAATEFATANGLWHKTPKFFERVSATHPSYENMPAMICAFRMLSDTGDLVARRLLRTAANATDVALDDTRRLLTERCGRDDLPYKAGTYTRRDVYQFSHDCFQHQLKKPSGELSTALRHDKKELVGAMAGFMQNSPLHHLATLGTEGTDLMVRLIRLGVSVKQTNRFGQTPLHVAVAMGHFEAARLLMRYDASLAAKDAKQLTPQDLGCRQAAWVDLAALAGVLGEDDGESPCDDEDDVVVHSPSRPRKDNGGWGAGAAHAEVEAVLAPLEARRPERLRGMKTHNAWTQVDVRDASDVNSMDVLHHVLGLSRPLLLRGGVTNKMAKKFARKAFLGKLAKMKGRAEAFPLAELYGSGVGEVVHLSRFWETAGAAEARPRTFTEKVSKMELKRFGAGQIDQDWNLVGNHPLVSLADMRFDFMQVGNEFKMNDTEEIFVSVGKRGSGFNAVAQGELTARALPFGHVKWFLQPPAHAFTSNEHPLDTFASRAAAWREKKGESLQGREALECDQHPGDLLLVPAHWGAVGVNLREGISTWKKMDMDMVFPTEQGEADERQGSPGGASRKGEL